MQDAGKTLRVPDGQVRNGQTREEKKTGIGKIKNNVEREGRTENGGAIRTAVATTSFSVGINK